MHAPAQQDVSREASRLEDKLSPSSKTNVSSVAPMLRVPAQPGAKAGPAAAACRAAARRLSGGAVPCSGHLCQSWGGSAAASVRPPS